MIRRVVLFKRKPEATFADFETAVSGLKSLDTKIPEIKKWWVSIAEGSGIIWDAALIGDFNSKEDVQKYSDHPAHVEVASRVAQYSEFAIFDSEI